MMPSEALMDEYYAQNHEPLEEIDDEISIEEDEE